MRYRIRIGKHVVVSAETDNEKEVEIAKKLVEEVSKKLGVEISLEVSK